MDFRILGPLEVCAEQRALPLGGAKQRALLALLLLHRNEVVSVDRVIDSLWGEAPPPAAAKSVQVYVSRLRRLLGPHGPVGSRLVTRPPGYVLETAPEETDLDRFEHLVDEARQAGASGEPAAAAAALRRALALWRGPPLSDVALAPFAQEAARRLEEQRLEALEARVEADLALGRAPELVGELSALVREHPYRERLRAALMLALYRSGRQAEALEAYRAARRALVDELGIDPSPALAQLERAILSHDPAVALPSAAPAPHLEKEAGAFLELEDPTGSVQIADLPSDGTAFVIGRSPDVNLVLDWDERVSRVHARLEREGEGWTIVDDAPVPERHLRERRARRRASSAPGPGPGPRRPDGPDLPFFPLTRPDHHRLARRRRGGAHAGAVAGPEAPCAGPPAGRTGPGARPRPTRSQPSSGSRSRSSRIICSSCPAPSGSRVLRELSSAPIWRGSPSMRDSGEGPAARRHELAGGPP